MRYSYRPSQLLNRSEKQFRMQCYHEAGHALVAWWQGLKVEFVYPQIANSKGDASLFVHKPTLAARPRVNDVIQRCRLTEKRVRICLAGPIAEIESGLVGLDEMTLNTDFEAASTLLARIETDCVERNAMMETLYEQTATFIDQRMPQLTRLASRLLIDEYLDADDMGEMLGGPRMMFDVIRVER